MKTLWGVGGLSPGIPPLSLPNVKGEPQLSRQHAATAGSTGPSGTQPPFAASAQSRTQSPVPVSLGNVAN